MPVCLIPTCRNNDRSTKGMGIMFHYVPSNPEVNIHWLKYAPMVNPKTARMCSEHFDEDAYERDLKAELLNIPVKRRLKPTAIPTLKLPRFPRGESSSSNTEDPTNPLSFVECVTDKTASENEGTSNDANATPVPLNYYVGSIELAKKLKASLQHKRAEITTLLSKLKKSKAEAQKLRKELAESKRKGMKVQIQVKREVNKALGKCFTPGQIRRLLSARVNCTNWEPDDIMSALSICAISLKAYVHLKNVIGIPLPGITTLRKWISTLSDVSGDATGKDVSSKEMEIVEIPSENEEEDLDFS